METIWCDLPSVKRGDIGEKLVNDFLVHRGYIPYSPDISKAHPFDRLVASSVGNMIFIAETKTKPARKWYPDTGIDVRHYEKYKLIQTKHNLRVFIFFVDTLVNKIYGGWLGDIEKPKIICHNGKFIEYPLTQNGIIYFPLDSMRDIADIQSSDADSINQLSTRNKAYDDVL